METVTLAKLPLPMPLKGKAPVPRNELGLVEAGVANPSTWNLSFSICKASACQSMPFFNTQTNKELFKGKEKN